MTHATPQTTPAGTRDQPAYEVVLASAGTGKTFALTNRLARLVAQGVPAERILASTFTRKAAGEIRQRLLERLARAALDPKHADELSTHAGVDLDQAGWQEALLRVGRSVHAMRIGTLDSLAQSLAQSLAPELGLPTPYRLASDHAAERLREQVVEAVLQDLLGNQDTRDTQDTQDAQAPTNTQAMDLLAELTGAQGGTNAPALLADLLHNARGILRRSPPDAWTCLEDEVKRAPTPKQAQHAAGKLAKLDPPSNANGKPDERFRKARQKVLELTQAQDWPALLGIKLVQASTSDAPNLF